MATRGGAIGFAIVILAAVGCSSDKAANTEAASSSSPAPPSTSSTTASDATPVGNDQRAQYVLHTDDGVTVRYTILAPEDNEVVQRIEKFHRDTGETRPYQLVLAEVDNRSARDFETSNLEITQADGDKIHFIEAWLYVSQWHRNVQDRKDSPVYMEGFDLENDLVERGIVEPNTTAVTVMAAEDLVDTVKSVTDRDRSGAMVPITRAS
jgi:hypothetical protein